MHKLHEDAYDNVQIHQNSPVQTQTTPREQQVYLTLNYISQGPTEWGISHPKLVLGITLISPL